jgi:hypothetical protein
MNHSTTLAPWVSLVMAAACSPLPAAAMGHFVCTVIEDVQLPAERIGHGDYLTYFTCNVTGGQLDGFLVNVSTRWELNGNEGKLLGAVGHAKRGDATVVYLTHEGTMKNVTKTGDPPALHWGTTTATAVVKKASGSAAHLNGRTFTMNARPDSPGKFSMDAVLVR